MGVGRRRRRLCQGSLLKAGKGARFTGFGLTYKVGPLLDEKIIQDTYLSLAFGVFCCVESLPP